MNAAPMRVGLIGCGAIGEWHARIVAEREDCVLAAVCDVDGARANALAEAFGTVPFADAEAFYEKAGLDAVIIASPEKWHLDHARLAAARRVPMLIEKPLAADVEGVRQIAEAAAAAGVAVMAGHVERFEVGCAQLKSAVAQGVCGRVVSIAARRQVVATDPPRFVGLSTTVRILGVHDFDLLSWIHSAPVLEVYAAAGRGRLFAETGLDDHVMTTIRFADGAVGLVESAWMWPLSYARYDRPSGWGPSGNNRLDVFGSTGLVSNDTSLRNQQLIAFDEANGFRAANIRHQPVLHGRVVGALREEVDAFVRMVRDDTPPLVGLDDARRALSLTEAAEISLVRGVPVRPAQA
jgi:predicted dehydrogenase